MLCNVLKSPTLQNVSRNNPPVCHVANAMRNPHLDAQYEIQVLILLRQLLPINFNFAAF